MGFFEDAQVFMQQKQKETESEPIWNPTEEATRTALFNECRRLYENATKQEIERAIDRVLDELDPPYHQTQFMKKLKTYLED